MGSVVDPLPLCSGCRSKDERCPQRRYWLQARGCQFCHHRHFEENLAHKGFRRPSPL